MASYYVDATSGSDAAAGTSAGAPWKTIAKVNASTFSAGDSVFLKRGETWRETLVMPSSGSSSSVITVSAYGSGANPILYSKDAFRYNNASASHALYDASGLGHRSNAGYAPNGDFEQGVASYYSASVFSGTGTLTADTGTFNTGTQSAKLFTGSNGVRLFLTDGLYLPANQKYEVSFYAKSDGVGTATVRLYEATGGLADAATGGVYQTWTGQQNIAALAVSAADTSWTEKKITILVNGSTHAIDFQITANAQVNQTVWIDSLRIKPLWTNYSGNTWMAGYETAQTGAIWMVAFDGVPTKQAADETAVNGTTRWFLKNSGSTHYDVLYANSSGDPGLSSETLDLLTTTNSKTLDGNAKTYVTYQHIDCRQGYHVAANLGANCTIDGCTLTVGVECASIGASNIVLTNSTLSYGDWIIDIYDAANNVLIRGNTVFGARKFAPLASNEGGGIAPSSIVSPIAGLVVENNHVYDCEFYGIAEYSSDATANVTNASYRRNRIHDVLYGIWSQTQFTTNSQFYGNVLYAPKSGGASGHTASMGLLYERGNNSVLFYGNTVSGFTYGVGLWNDANALTVKNNIFLGCTKNVYDAFDVAVAVFDYNCYFPNGAGTFDYHGSHSLTFAQWQALAQDAHGVAADPLLTSSSTGDFTLLAGSPARDAGVNLGLVYADGLHPGAVWPSAVSVLAQDGQGAGWDMGAYVYRVSGGQCLLFAR